MPRMRCAHFRWRCGESGHGCACPVGWSAKPFSRKNFRLRAIAHSMLSGAVGVLAWFLVFLAAVVAIRGICYPVIAADNVEGAWGGPTLAGAWVVHAVIGVGLLPVWLLTLAGLGAFQVRLTRGLLGRNGQWWPLPVALLLAAGGGVLFLAWLRRA
ncbi:sensor domain-containing protein [Nocardia sp. NPDC049190]|uniref:sensor domain-containing protein n=1 Tax=Nocardia sp. NPDC049190 TaxID=3155650 RepID=UPI0033D54912